MAFLFWLVYALVQGIVALCEIIKSAMCAMILMAIVHLTVSATLGHLATIPFWYPAAFAGITLIFWAWIREFGIRHFFRKSAPPTPT